MNRIILLEQLKKVTQKATSELILPVSAQKGDEWGQKERPAEIYLMRLPDSKSATKKCPYILHQFVIGEDSQQAGQKVASTVMVRSVFAVYHDDEQEGALALMNLMERVRIALLREPIIGGQFALDLSQGFQAAVDYEDTAPYFKGEMVTNWILPAVEREDVRKWL